MANLSYTAGSGELKNWLVTETLFDAEHVRLFFAKETAIFVSEMHWKKSMSLKNAICL